MTTKRRLIYQLNIARHSLMKLLDSECKQALGISSVQLSALMVLKEQPGCLMKDLAATLLLDKSAVTGLIKRMEVNQLIIRQPCENDLRACRIMVSSHGEVLLAKGLQKLITVNQHLEQGFSSDELDVVSRFLAQAVKLSADDLNHS